MAWNNICKSLRDILAELSPIEDDARRLIKDAHLPETEINFSGSASNFWTSIIDRADKDEMLISLIETALDNFPRHPILSDIERELRRSEKQRHGQAPIPPLLRYSADRDDQKMTLQESFQEAFPGIGYTGADHTEPCVELAHQVRQCRSAQKSATPTTNREDRSSQSPR